MQRAPLLAIAPCLTVALLVGATLSAQDPEKVELAWKKPEGATLFEEGKAHFEAKAYKDAISSFEDARKQAKDRPTKHEVDRWIDGTKGANELEALRKQVEAGRKAAAYAHAEKNLSKYDDTPIGEEYKSFVEMLEKELFFVLEDFDRESNRYSEKYGKTFIDDPEMVKQGKKSLRWEVDKDNFELKVKNLPGDMAAYENGAVIFWLHFEKNGGPFQLVFNVPGKSSSDRGTRIDNAFIKTGMQSHKGWKRIEVPLKQFNAQGDVSWDRVRDFRIQFLGGRRFTCTMDQISLRK